MAYVQQSRDRRAALRCVLDSCKACGRDLAPAQREGVGTFAARFEGLLR